MSLETCFINLFDKVSDINFANRQLCRDAFTVKEHNAGSSKAPLKSLQVKQKGTLFTCFNNNLVQGMKDISCTRSGFLKDSDCDGIIFITNCTKDGLIFVELKSRFSTQHIEKAIEQIIFSFLKMHAMLSMCKEYSPDTVYLHFIVACQCFEDKIQEDQVYDYLNKAEELEDMTIEGTILRKLIENNTIQIKLREITDLWRIPLNTSLRDKDITLSLKLTNSYGDSITEYSF